MRRAAVILAALLLAAPAHAAVDTAAKRASVVNMAGYQPPLPDGTVAEADRAHLAMVYGGFDYSESEPMQVAVPDVVGEASFAAADTILEGDGLDSGLTVTRCSAVTADQIISQSPPAGTLVELGSLVNLTASTGTPCEGGRRLKRLGIGVEQGR